jgi:hypothetical protein
MFAGAKVWGGRWVFCAGLMGEGARAKSSCSAESVGKVAFHAPNCATTFGGARHNDATLGRVGVEIPSERPVLGTCSAMEKKRMMTALEPITDKMTTNATVIAKIQRLDQKPSEESPK